MLRERKKTSREMRFSPSSSRPPLFQRPHSPLFLSLPLLAHAKTRQTITKQQIIAELDAVAPWERLSKRRVAHFVSRFDYASRQRSCRCCRRNRRCRARARSSTCRDTRRSRYRACRLGSCRRARARARSCRSSCSCSCSRRTRSCRGRCRSRSCCSSRLVRRSGWPLRVALLGFEPVDRARVTRWSAIH